ncbi:sorting nexin-13-like isoform X2 [Tachypleus tridentatus]|uniref:sorting nexin-13-like isoform X2 n=1 Tax=Tachypleus tridentatus TaxID=6853 RepID=UPI003FD18A6E
MIKGSLVPISLMNHFKRSKEVEWVPYLTTRLVDDFASHLRLFRKSQAKLKVKKEEDPGSSLDLLSIFFDKEFAMEQHLCRDLVCTSRTHEIEYLQDLSEILVYLLLPPEDFQNRILRFFVRLYPVLFQELLVHTIILPIVDLFSDPDYINQSVVWLCKDTLMSSEDFLVVLRSTSNTEELLAVKEIVTHEIAVQRSKDTGEDDSAEIKQQLSSLFYVQKVVDIRLKRLREGGIDTDSTGLPSQIDWNRLMAPGVKLFSLPFDMVLKNNIALSYFIDYMTGLRAQCYIFFYLNVEGFRASAEQQLSLLQTSKLKQAQATPPDIENLREAALNIFETYLSEKASPRIKLDDFVLKKLMCRIRTERPNEAWFDEAQGKVYEIMLEDRFFPAFKKTPAYIKLLAELDLLKDLGARSDDEEYTFGMKQLPIEVASISSLDNVSLSSLDAEEDGLELLTSDGQPTFELPITAVHPLIENDDGQEHLESIFAEIYNTGIVQEGGRSYAVYAISVIRQLSNCEEEKWCVMRRYSDFHNFHTSLIEKYPSLSYLQLPGKKAFNNMSHQFLEKRKLLLNQYLQRLLRQNIFSEYPKLIDMVLCFLEPGLYEKEKRPLSKTVGTLVNPLRSSVKTMGNIVKTMPDNLIDGLKDGLVKVLGGRFSPSLNPVLPDSGKVAAGIDIETQDNIPLRILVLLMDEVFDLKSKNQWLRRRIVVLLRQIIKATFGDTINRKILDYVEWITSSEQVAHYVKTFKQNFWPNGSLALPSPERDANTKLRTRIATKMVMLCSISDELKHIIGSETTRKGLLCVFEMFQHPELNRRLIYVLLEGILELLFPDNQLSSVFKKLHSRSPRFASKDSSISDSKGKSKITPVKR